MKHLLNGVAVVAALAIAAPVWAQTAAPMSPSSRAPAAAPAATAPAASAAAPAAPMAKARHKRAASHRKATRRGMARKASPDSVANQLNAQELSRVQGGGAAPPPGGLMAPGTLGGGYGQPAPTQGIPGGNQPSASSHPPPSR